MISSSVCGKVVSIVVVAFGKFNTDGNSTGSLISLPMSGWISSSSFATSVSNAGANEDGVTATDVTSDAGNSVDVTTDGVTAVISGATKEVRGETDVLV